MQYSLHHSPDPDSPPGSVQIVSFTSLPSSILYVYIITTCPVFSVILANVFYIYILDNNLDRYPLSKTELRCLLKNIWWIALSFWSFQGHIGRSFLAFLLRYVEHNTEYPQTVGAVTISFGRPPPGLLFLVSYVISLIPFKLMCKLTPVFNVKPRKLLHG